MALCIVIGTFINKVSIELHYDGFVYDGCVLSHHLRGGEYWPAKCADGSEITFGMGTQPFDKLKFELKDTDEFYPEYVLWKYLAVQRAKWHAKHHQSIIDKYQQKLDNKRRGYDRIGIQRQLNSEKEFQAKYLKFIEDSRDK